MSKLINKINPNEYIKLSTYAKNYSVCKRSLYRQVKSDYLNHIEIDGIYFLKNISYLELKTNRKHGNAKSVTKLTVSENIVSNLTLSNIEDVENESFTNIVTNETLSNEEIELLNKPENECSIDDFKKIKEIRKKI